MGARRNDIKKEKMIPTSLSLVWYGTLRKETMT